MGLSKVYKRGDKVIVHHQLGMDGKPYGEDLVITGPPGRLDYYNQFDGVEGVFNFSFNPNSVGVTYSGVVFPEPPAEE